MIARKLKSKKIALRLAGLALLSLVLAGTAQAASTVSCAIGGGNVPTGGWTLHGIGGGVGATAAPFVSPGGSATNCFIVTDYSDYQNPWPGTVSTGYMMSSALGNPGIEGTTNGSQMISPVFTAAPGQRLVFDFMFATNDGTGTFSDWANMALVPQGGGPVLDLFTARTGDDNQVVPGYGFPSLAPGLVLTPGIANLLGDSWCLNALTGANSCLDPYATQYGPGRYPGEVSGPYTGGSSDWNHAVFTFDGQSAGTYRMVMNVSNVGDEIYSSALFFTGASFTGGSPVEPPEGEEDVPEPGTLALLGSGLLVLAGAFAAARKR